MDCRQLNALLLFLNANAEVRLAFGGLQEAWTKDYKFPKDSDKRWALSKPQTWEEMRVFDWEDGDDPTEGDEFFRGELVTSTEALCVNYQGDGSMYSANTRDFDFLLYCAGVMGAPKQTWSEFGGALLPSLGRMGLVGILGVIPGLGWLQLAAGAHLVSANGAMNPQANGKEKEAQLTRAYFNLIRLLYDRRFKEVCAVVPDLVFKVDALDKKILAAIDSGDLSQWTTLLGRRQRILLSLDSISNVVPLLATRPDSATHVADLARETRIDAAVAALLLEYPHIPGLVRLFRVIRQNSVSLKPRRVQIYLYGPPGVGKSRFVKRLAEVLELPLETFAIQDHEDLRTLCASSGGVASEALWEDKNTSDLALTSLIPYSMLKNGINNPVLFIDEASAVVTGQVNGFSVSGVRDAVKRLFDDDIATLSTPHLAREHQTDYSRMTIILAANHPISPEFDDANALDNRFVSIHFTEMTPEVMGAALNEGVSRLGTRQLLPSEHDLVRGLVCQKIPDVVREARAKGYEGARVPLRVNESIYAMLADKVYRRNKLLGTRINADFVTPQYTLEDLDPELEELKEELQLGFPTLPVSPTPAAGNINIPNANPPPPAEGLAGLARFGAVVQPVTLPPDLPLPVTTASKVALEGSLKRFSLLDLLNILVLGVLVAFWLASKGPLFVVA